MKNITLLFCLFLANILLGACSGGEDEKKEMDEGKGAYALFLKKSITVSTGESQTDDKWDFAAGVGNYRNATAAAVGLFYRPNERTMFNLGWTMGDNRNMVNGGFSVKFGKSNKYVKYSKAEMASVIDNQSREIAELKAKDAQNAKYNAEMRAEIEALKKQVEALAVKK